MRKIITFFLGAIFGLLISGPVVTGLANTEIDKANLVLSGQIISDVGLESFKEKAEAAARKAGVNIIARSEEVTPNLLLEGSWEHEGRMAIEEFASMNPLKEFWFSSDYQEAIKLRERVISIS